MLLANVIFLFYIGIIGIAVGYGEFLALFPTFTNQQFGSYNYGIVYQAYGLTVLLGIFTKSFVGIFTKSFVGIFTKSFVSNCTNTFVISALAGSIGLIIAFTIKEKKINTN